MEKHFKSTSLVTSKTMSPMSPFAESHKLEYCDRIKAGKVATELTSAKGAHEVSEKEKYALIDMAIEEPGSRGKPAMQPTAVSSSPESLGKKGSLGSAFDIAPLDSTVVCNRESKLDVPFESLDTGILRHWRTRPLSCNAVAFRKKYRHATCIEESTQPADMNPR